MVSSITTWILSSKKAIAAFIVTALVGNTARFGLDLDADAQAAVRVLLEGLIGAVVVYFTTNKVGAVERKK